MATEVVGDREFLDRFGDLLTGAELATIYHRLGESVPPGINPQDDDLRNTASACLTRKLLPRIVNILDLELIPGESL